MRPRMSRNYKYYKGDWEWRGMAIVNTWKTFRMTKDWDKCLIALNNLNPEKAMVEFDWYDIREDEKDRWTWDDGSWWKLWSMLAYHNAFTWSVQRFINDRMPWGQYFKEPFHLKKMADLRSWKEKYLYVW